jgi:hypothetical protein
MFLTRKHLSRRTILKGADASREPASYAAGPDGYRAEDFRRQYRDDRAVMSEHHFAKESLSAQRFLVIAVVVAWCVSQAYAQDARNVTEPRIPQSYATLTAALRSSEGKLVEADETKLGSAIHKDRARGGSSGKPCGGAALEPPLARSRLPSQSRCPPDSGGRDALLEFFRILSLG